MPVTVWIPTAVVSQNKLRTKYRNHHAYARLLNQYRHDLWVQKLRAELPDAAGKRRLTIRRLIERRGKSMDAPNIIGGAKPLIDALVREKLLVDDTQEYLELAAPEEVRDERGGVELVLEDV